LKRRRLRGGCAGNHRQLTQTYFCVREIKVHKKIFKNIAANEPVRFLYRTLIDYSDWTMLKLEITNPDGIGERNITLRA